eukprot:3567437-Ditylum_brightwellii.AAC.1
MICYVSSSVSAVECVIPKAVSETTISLKVMQEMDVEMYNLVKEKYGIESKGMKELRIIFKHYILAHFNISVETKVPHIELDTIYTLLGVPAQNEATTISFFIQIAGQQNLWFKLHPGFHILYSAHLLTHQQYYQKLVMDGNINIGAYTPKYLLHNFVVTYWWLTGDEMEVKKASSSSDEECSRDGCSSGDDDSFHDGEL